MGWGRVALGFFEFKLLFFWKLPKALLKPIVGHPEKLPITGSKKEIIKTKRDRKR
jgi:hypothetical protein